jgi:exonuclease SbcD
VKLLHTADWHIGQVLYGRKRYEEFETFFRWLVELIAIEGIEVLLIAGDIFDTNTPSNRALNLYYNFLMEAGQQGCRHIVIIAGNHDSPSLIEAPKNLLSRMNIHVVGQVTEHPEEALIVLKDLQHQVEAIICAIPYLRERDIRLTEAGESLADKEQKRLAGIAQRYQQIGALAEALNQTLPQPVPIIGMGHLFTREGITQEGDGVRDLYVGSLGHVSANIFPTVMDYVALGHLHIPQQVGNTEKIRYSGSPLPMGFGEATQTKSLCLLEFSGRQSTLRLLPIPRFQALIRIQGDWQQIEKQVLALRTEQPKAWIEITYKGEELIANLRERVDVLIDKSSLEVLRIKNLRTQQTLSSEKQEDNLEDLTPQEVFQRCLVAYHIPESQQTELNESFAEILIALQQDQ